MRFTNKHNLPASVVNAIMADPYNKGDARMSVTQLLSPPRQVALKDAYFQDIEMDVSDMVWSLFGKIGHSILEHTPEDQVVKEERLFANVLGWPISGAIDQQVLKPTDTIAIKDFKFTSDYAAMNGKVEWEQQLNAYAWLVRQHWKANGYDAVVDELQILAMIRNHSRAQAEKDPDYPQAAVQVIEVPLWSDEEQEAFVFDRVARQQEADTVMSIGSEDELPACTDEERWIRSTGWSAMKPGAKRSTKNFDTKDEADAWVAKKNVDDAEKKGFVTLEVVERKGSPIRCQSYCPVARWCSQYQSELAAEADNKETAE